MATTATITKPKNKNGIILGSIIILFILAGLVWWIVNKGKKPVTQSNPNVSPTPTTPHNTSGGPNPTNAPNPPVSTHTNPSSNVGKDVVSKYGGTYVYRISDDTIYRTLYADEVGFKVVNETSDKVDNGINYIWKATSIYFK